MCCTSLSWADVNTADDAKHATCLYCIACKGCVACTPGRITENTLAKGRWITGNRRVLWPFEFDNRHLLNTIAKLQRDQYMFKKDWLGWLDVFVVERTLRGL